MKPKSSGGILIAVRAINGIVLETTLQSWEDLGFRQIWNR
jgi:hypothetical protein